jgi:4-hydroxybenzoate polyprenyltransferase
MNYFVFFLVLSLILFIFSQPREVINEIWQDIEEYENMKRTGFKAFPESLNRNPDSGSIFIDFLFFSIIVTVFGIIGYLLNLAI